MKYLLTTFLMLGMLSSIFAQDGKVVAVAIGVKDMNCNGSSYRTHLNYSWQSGTDYNYCISSAKESIRANYSGLDDIYTKYGQGNYLVILRSDKKYESWSASCDKDHYAVGIGIDAETAWRKAKNDLPWTWSERDGYQILVDQTIR
jgi:hypothetical protein